MVPPPPLPIHNPPPGVVPPPPPIPTPPPGIVPPPPPSGSAPPPSRGSSSSNNARNNLQEQIRSGISLNVNVNESKPKGGGDTIYDQLFAAIDLRRKAINGHNDSRKKTKKRKEDIAPPSLIGNDDTLSETTDYDDDF